MYDNQCYYDIFVIHEVVVYLETCNLKYGGIFLHLHHDGPSYNDSGMFCVSYFTLCLLVLPL
jgi:hypothetical protein